MSTISKPQELDRFAPTTQQVIRLAQQQAMQMAASSIAPEHMLLALVLQSDERVLKALNQLGMEFSSLRAQSEALIQPHMEKSVEVDDPLFALPLSRETRECIEWTLCFISQMHTSTIQPEHLLLGVLRHPRTQPLLSFLVPEVATLQTRISEAVGPAYSSYMDQLIQSRAREQSLVYYQRGPGRRVLRKLERPTELFVDIEGMEAEKRALMDVVGFLKGYPSFQASAGRFPRGILLATTSINESRLLVRATAGEAVVPLLTLSLTALVELLVDLQAQVLQLDDLELPGREYVLLRKGGSAERGQRYLQHIFQEAKTLSPVIVALEGLDALTRLEHGEGRAELISQLGVELESIDKHYRMVVIASTEHPHLVDPVLLKIGRFEQQITNVSLASGSELQHFCATCRRELQSGWSYCMYCGASQARVCSHCGTPRPTLEGALFCAHCGTSYS
ncbi:AAA family ATPase [Tengunoibacter tsumagoiensis]|uniref:Clp R domain-containing protein n=1 Tax=Tengunoibacter tsumagoiensis TaxID=2014871 RepID=A0A401ZYI6_9CHLR|nr:AAA family ATPase [Tengunoibacter tsumagoiensis]GCE11893.1 hypothetical protein KTT_17520 [Tengunoibacter tsumagoiensis]